jgi:hypothetical protein
VAVTRRSFVAVVAALAMPWRSVSARLRSVYDLAGDAYIEKPSWVTCDPPTLDRVAGAAVVDTTCRPIRGARVPRKGGTVLMKADVEYADTGEDIGSCEASARVVKKGAVSVSCSVFLPDEPVLPLTISGVGPGISAPFILLGGSLIFETTATPNFEDYGWIDINLSNGDDYSLWDSDGAPTQTEVNYVWDRSQAIITSRTDGPWTVVIRDAFP